MAEYGEWNRKGATLSDKTAKKEGSSEESVGKRAVFRGRAYRKRIG